MIISNSDTMKPKLKPCPFCGNPADLWKDWDDGTYEPVYCVGCTHCTIRTDWTGKQKEAVQQWNARINVPKPVNILQCHMRTHCDNFGRFTECNDVTVICDQYKGPCKTVNQGRNSPSE